MPTYTPRKRRRLVDLFDLMCNDIRVRGLKPGDIYYTAEEAANRLGVSKADANRALQLLASKQLLNRRQGQPPQLARHIDEATPDAAIHRVHVLLPEADIKSEGLFSDGNMIGLQSALPGSQIQFNFLPERGEEEYVSQLVKEALSESRMEAFVLMRSSLKSQQAVAASGLPAVVNGTSYPSVENISSMDRNHVLSAKLQLEYVTRSGCRHVVMLMRDKMYAGDQVFFDSLVESYAASPHFKSVPKFYFLPSDEGMVKKTITTALAEVKGKIGVIARSMSLGAHCVTACEELHLNVPDDITISICDYHPMGPAKAINLPHEIDTNWSPQEHGRQTGMILRSQAKGELEKPAYVRYDTKFVDPFTNSEFTNAE